MNCGFLIAVCCLLFGSGIEIVSPRDGAKVSLLKRDQAEFLAASASVRESKIADRTACAGFAKCGGRPASVTLKWRDATSGGGSRIYAVTLAPKNGKMDRFVVSNATEVVLVNLETGRDYEWSVSRVGVIGAQAIAEFATIPGPRLVYVPGVPNCRDIGGVKGLDGRMVREGMVYRTAAYNLSSRQVEGSLLGSSYVAGERRITKAGRNELANAFGVKTDLDLRSEVECAAMASSPLGDGVRWIHVPLRAYEWLDNDRKAFAKALRVFADAANYPIAFHCAGGRDRAGSLAYVLGAIVGVGDDDLMKDWELSVFETGGNELSPQRIEGLVKLLRRYPGKTTCERAVAFVRDCGITEAEIVAIRDNLLEAK